MLFHSLRKTLLIGATIAALALPSAAAAADELTTNHQISLPEQQWSEGDLVSSEADPPVLAGLSPEECRFLELNIPEYDCQLTLAQWAAVDVETPYPAPPPGVDYLFWEQNVWELAGAASYAWIRAPDEVDDDLSYLENRIPEY